MTGHEMAETASVINPAPVRWEVVHHANELPQLQGVWGRLSDGLDAPVSFDTYTEAVAPGSDDAIRLVVVKAGDVIIGLLPFIRRPGQIRYPAGRICLGRRNASLYAFLGQDALGQVSRAVFHQVIDDFTRRPDCHLLEFRDIPADGRVARWMTQQSDANWTWSSKDRKRAVHWLIDLPNTTDELLAEYPARMRQTLKRKHRHFFRVPGTRVVCVTERDQVDRFLTHGAQISRRTYQWHIGQRLMNDDPTRREFELAAAHGSLRCYLLLRDDVPVAFLRGFLRGTVYDYQTPGYDPQFAKESPGTVLLLHVLDDLIRNTECRQFDFGEGGDDADYKSRFGNRSFESTTIYVAARRRLYPRMLLLMLDGLNAAKNAASRFRR